MEEGSPARDWDAKKAEMAIKQKKEEVFIKEPAGVEAPADRGDICKSAALVHGYFDSALMSKRTAGAGDGQGIGSFHRIALGGNLQVGGA